MTDEEKLSLKERMKIQHIDYPRRDPAVRVEDFDDIVVGYDEQSARIEASRCLDCAKPSCVAACPVHNDIPRAMGLIVKGDFIGAANVYRETSIFPEICGRVCPQEKLCEGACTRGKGKRGEPLGLGKLEMFVADYQRRAEGGWPALDVASASGRRVAVVGGGPAGFAVAEKLAVKGHAVTVFEAMPYAGGLLMYGIPTFKLPRSIISEKVAHLESLGIEFVYNTRIGKDRTVDDLLGDGFDAVFLGHGANVDATARIPGIDLPGVHLSSDYLVRTNSPKELVPEAQREAPVIGDRVAVIGGGDTAMDCLRTSVRLGAKEVVCYYRRTEAEMPGSKKERVHAQEEGVRIDYLVAPVEFIAGDDGRLVELRLQRMELGEPDDSGRRRPVPIERSEFTVPVDSVILALGYWPDETISKSTPDLGTHDWGLIEADESGATSRKGVFAAGDGVTGPDLVVTAAAAGYRAAEAIDAYLAEK